MSSRHWSAYLASSAISSDMADLFDKVKNRLYNLVVASEYLET